MNKIKQIAVSSKEFVKRHKVAIAISTTAVACLALNRRALRNHDDFLKERGLFDEFYSDPEES